MDNPNSEPEAFDVFLCHNSKDKDEVRAIADNLKELGIKPWLDERDLDPGRNWETTIKEQIKITKSAAIFLGNSGTGEYQEKEIKDIINEHDKRNIPVIPVFLPSGTDNLVLPDEIKNFHAIDFRKKKPDPLLQLLKGISGDSHPSRILPRISEPPNKEQRDDLLILSDLVKEFWSDRILTSTLQNQILIPLRKVVASNKVGSNLSRLNKLSDVDNRLEKDVPIEFVLDVSKYLIILGEPGSGKTTTLLELAQRLITRAQAHYNESIPIVLNLASWNKGQLLSKWIENELKKIHKLPEEDVHNWLDKGYLIPLLDGLDEVKTEFQADCVEAIDVYIAKNSPPGLVVCCRLQDYQKLPQSQGMRGAIRLEPLDREQLDDYFVKIGPNFRGIQTAINADTDLLELATSPFMLDIMSKASQSNKPVNFLAQTQSLDERRKQIFEAYVDWTFEHKESQDKTFPKQKILFWLSWLAKKMIDKSQSRFLIENLQPDWLDSWKQKLDYRIVSAISFSLLVGLMSALILLISNLSQPEPIPGSVYGLIVAIAFGLLINTDAAIISGVICVLLFSVVGMLMNGQKDIVNWIADGIFLMLLVVVGIGSLNNIKTIEKMFWSWKLSLKNFSIGFLIYGVTTGLLGGLYHSQILGLKDDGLLFGAFIGLLCGLIGGLISGIIGGFIKLRTFKKMPNQGIIMTLVNGLKTYLPSLLIIGLVEGFIYWLFGPGSKAFIIALILGLQLALVIALNHGLSVVIKHYSLRLVLWRCGYTPSFKKFIPCLDYCAKLILLKKRGGSYEFLHRMLLEYFANLEISAIPPIKKNITKNIEHPR